MRLETLWLRGVFPEALLARSARHWQAWRENYVRTFIDRDSGILHHLLGISSLEPLLTSPVRGNSFEGVMIEQLIAQEKLRHPGSAFYYFRTQTGAEIDLIIDRGQVRVGIEFKSGAAVEASDTRHLRMGPAEGIIHRGLVIYNGTRAFAISDRVSVMPATQALGKDSDL